MFHNYLVTGGAGFIGSNYVNWLVQHGDWRPGDQRVFYADISKAKKELDWSPKIGVERGIKMLFDWVSENKSLF